MVVEHDLVLSGEPEHAPAVTGRVFVRRLATTPIVATIGPTRENVRAREAIWKLAPPVRTPEGLRIPWRDAAQLAL
jgi:hypothetical protein